MTGNVGQEMVVRLGIGGWRREGVGWENGRVYGWDSSMGGWGQEMGVGRGIDWAYGSRGGGSGWEGPQVGGAGQEMGEGRDLSIPPCVTRPTKIS